MASKSKEKEYHFSFQTIIRLIIFSAIIYFLISLISTQKIRPNQKYDPTILGEEISSSSAQLLLKNTIDTAYDKLPPKSRETIKNLDKSPLFITIQKNLDYLKKETENFPQKQIKEIKKAIINSIYEDMMKNIDSNDQ